MTKEEILEHFKDINGAYNESTRYDDLKRMLEELALSAEPCEDCISRQAVMDFIRGLRRWYVMSEDRKLTGVGLLYDDVMFGLDRLPSVTPKRSDVLDKIRAEIENDWQLKEFPSSPFSCGLRRAIEIIDKYTSGKEIE